MAEKRSDKIKYGLLKAIDVSGFKVFDPVVRLCFREETGKQCKEIGKFLITPVLFVIGCLLIWSAVAPRHKTKSGEVPTPARIVEAARISHTLDRREDEKEADFQRTGNARTAAIGTIAALQAEKEQLSSALKEELATTEERVQAKLDGSVAPVTGSIEKFNERSKAAKATRDAALLALAGQVVTRERSTSELLLAGRKHNAAAESEAETLKKLKTRRNEILGDPPRELLDAQLASNAVANEVQHLKKRSEWLQQGNRSVKVAAWNKNAQDAEAQLTAATEAGAAVKAAKNVVKFEKKAEDGAEQEYPRTVTVYFQLKRSLFTVFCGFLMAAFVAIPLGIMCGVNRVVMACLTPVISIFKPVSPVVWLLIFQIVIGAFFLPDPEKHPLFLFFGALPLVSSLGVNPALIFCACTVAMCAVWPALVNTALGVSSIDQDHLNVARVLRLGFWSRLFKIIIPSSLPLVFAGLRISMGVGWMVLIAAEALSSSDGLGKFVWDEYQNGSSHSFANIIYACFVIGIVGFFLDRIMIFLQRLVSFDDGATAV